MVPEGGQDLKNRVFIESLAYSPDNEDYLPRGYSIPFKEFQIDSSHGKISALELNGGDADKPVIIHFHGSGFNVTKHITHVDWMPSMGFKVICFDYPGYGSSNGTANRESVVEGSQAVLKDIAATFPDRDLAIFSQSLGSAIALETLVNSEVSNTVSSLVMDSTFSTYKKMAEIKLSKRDGIDPHLKAKGSSLLSHDHDPIIMIEQLTLPMLLLHSKSDPIVPFSHALELVDHAGGDIEFWVQNGLGHTEVFRKNYKNSRAKTAQWILQHRTKKPNV